MKKVSLVVMEKYRELSLEKLRELGVVHLETLNLSSERLSKLLEQKARIEAALGILRNYEAAPEDTAAPEIPYGRRKEDRLRDDEAFYSAEVINRPAVPDPADQVLALVDERKSIQERLAADIKEQSRIEKWGDFDPALLADLTEKGITLIPYELPRRVYETLGETSRVVVLSREKSLVYCVALDEAVPGENPLVLPEKSLSEIRRGIAEKQDTLGDIEKQLTRLASRKAAIRDKLEKLIEAIEFESARVNMERIEGVSEDLTVCWLLGYIPYDQAGVLKRGAAENGWALMLDDPEESDNPPTLVRNNPFVRLIQPLFNLLGTTPGYREYDISLSYLIFFSLFFAMIFGDAGYGTILFLGALILGFRSKAKSGRIPDGILLLGLLSAATIIWGSITGSWFAAPLEKLPAFLRGLVIPPFRPDPSLDPKAAANLVQQNIKHFCFIVGAGQIVLAHLKNIKKEFPSLTAVAQLGWLCLVVGLYFLVLNVVLDKNAFPVPSFALYLIGGGLGAFFIFANQRGGNFFKNILISFSNFLTTFLNSVSSFSDIISYIRLFAVGLAGASIAASFNDMAFGLPAGPVRIIGGALILLFGHGLNLAMNALSVVVHGVRLNLLEYAGHLGIEWSGHKYSPFALKKNGQGNAL
jgi:V/A-type H+-transporting ATPase subunit I